MKIEKSPSLNFNDRKDGKTPHYIILHYTDTKDTAEALRYLCDPKREVSAHYVIEENGNILQLVEEDKRAWHAGESYWKGETDMNSVSIGIEFVNPGHTYGLKPFPEPQITAGVALCKKIMEKWGIPPKNVLGHEDIAPGRKIDPGPLFPWEALAQEGVGLWPDPERGRSNLLRPQCELRSYFTDFGYDPNALLDDIITAFHRHYAPEKFKEDENPATPDSETIAKLRALI